MKIQTAGKASVVADQRPIGHFKIEAGKVEIHVEHSIFRGAGSEVVSTIQPLADKNNNELRDRVRRIDNDVIGQDQDVSGANKCRKQRLQIHRRRYPCRSPSAAAPTRKASASDQVIDNGIGIRRNHRAAVPAVHASRYFEYATLWRHGAGSGNQPEVLSACSRVTFR